MRLIDADKLEAELRKTKFLDANDKVIVCAVIENAPTIDAVPVVRCKDCKWHEDKEPGMVWCSHIVGSWIGEEDYCSMGERREDAEKTD